MKAVLLPVKRLNRSKNRLSPLLSASRRRDLMWAMVQDVAEALSACRTEAQVAVVTADERVADLTLHHDWQLIWESSQVSESASVDAASSLLMRQGCSQLLRLPGDLPLLRAEDVEELLQLPLSPRAVALVPSRDGTGTNAILRSPPDACPSFFGPDSFFKHVQEAKKRKLEVLVVENHRISVDVDEPADLLEIWRHGRGTKSWDLLKRLRLFVGQAGSGEGIRASS